MSITGPLGKDIIMRDYLVFRFLDLYQLAKLVGFAGLALANDLGVFLKQA